MTSSHIFVSLSAIECSLTKYFQLQPRCTSATTSSSCRDTVIIMEYFTALFASLLLILLERADGFLISDSLSRQKTSLSSDSNPNSIGDYTLGLHGGKYQFSEAGFNLEAQSFAETGYGSNVEASDDFSKEDLPRWALRLNKAPSMDCPLLEISDGGTVVEFQNDERSWERYYAMIVGDGHPPYVVDPAAGILAPRGGTSSHSDTGRVMVSKRGQPSMASWWLLIGTEAETWSFKLVEMI